MKKLTYKESKEFIANEFLKCPECNRKCRIVRFESYCFVVVCSCTKWKISFKISEE